MEQIDQECNKGKQTFKSCHNETKKGKKERRKARHSLGQLCDQHIPGTFQWLRMWSPAHFAIALSRKRQRGESKDWDIRRICVQKIMRGCGWEKDAVHTNVPSQRAPLATDPTCCLCCRRAIVHQAIMWREMQRRTVFRWKLCIQYERLYFTVCDSQKRIKKWERKRKCVRVGERIK